MAFASRMLALLGLDLDFSIELRSRSFSPITETLYVGVRPEPDDLAELRGSGITHVVSCLEESRLATLELPGFRTLPIAARDGMDEDLGAAFPRLFAFADGAQDAKLLVHCQAGVSRSATLATALLMKAEQRTFFDAFGRLRSKRREVLPNIGFASQLQRLEHALHPDLRERREPSSLARYLREVCQAPVEVELLQEVLARHDYDAPRALRAIFGGEIPRVVQGVRA